MTVLPRALVTLVAAGVLAGAGGCSTPSPTGGPAPTGALTATPSPTGTATSLIASSPTSTPASTTTAPPTAPPLPLCEAQSGTIEIGGHPVLLARPTTTVPVPVFVALHGYKGTPEGLARYSQLDALAAAGQALVAYPAGTPLDLGFGWNSGAGRFATTSGDDVAVVASVVDELLRLPCADPSRVYLVGESNGGGMALRATCDPRFDGRLAGLVLVNPAIDEGVLDTCSGAVRPVPVIAVTGSLDKVVPVDGSRNPFVAVNGWYPRVSQVVSGCVLPPGEPSPVGDQVSVVVGGGCAVCSVLFMSADGGHTWPGASEGVNGAPPGSYALTARLSSLATGAALTC